MRCSSFFSLFCRIRIHLLILLFLYLLVYWFFSSFVSYIPCTCNIIKNESKVKLCFLYFTIREPITDFCPFIETLLRKHQGEAWRHFPLTLCHWQMFLVLLRGPIHSECRMCYFSLSPLFQNDLKQRGHFLEMDTEDVPVNPHILTKRGSRHKWKQCNIISG